MCRNKNMIRGTQRVWGLSRASQGDIPPIQWYWYESACAPAHVCKWERETSQDTPIAYRVIQKLLQIRQKPVRQELHQQLFNQITVVSFSLKKPNISWLQLFQWEDLLRFSDTWLRQTLHHVESLLFKTAHFIYVMQLLRQSRKAQDQVAYKIFRLSV